MGILGCFLPFFGFCGFRKAGYFWVLHETVDAGWSIPDDEQWSRNAIVAAAAKLDRLACQNDRFRVIVHRSGKAFGKTQRELRLKNGFDKDCREFRLILTLI
jgi:hypothetical protein